MRIILIEDRKDRLDSFSACNLQDYDFLEVTTGVQFDECKHQLEQDANKYLDNFQCIISHRSAFPNEIRENIKSHCKKSSKPLLFFSGGISTSIFSSHGFPFLHINAKDFYSSNLCLFLDSIKETSEINLLIMQFGEHWKLNMLLNFRNHIAVGHSAKTIRRFGDLQMNPLLKSYLSNKAELNWLNAGALTSIDEKQIMELKSITGELILQLL